MLFLIHEGFKRLFFHRRYRREVFEDRNARRSIFRAVRRPRWAFTLTEIETIIDPAYYTRGMSQWTCAPSTVNPRSARSAVKAIYFERAIYSGSIKSTAFGALASQPASQLGQSHDFSTETRRVSRTRLSDVCQVIISRRSIEIAWVLRLYLRENVES